MAIFFKKVQKSPIFFATFKRILATKLFQILSNLFSLVYRDDFSTISEFLGELGPLTDDCKVRCIWSFLVNFFNISFVDFCFYFCLEVRSHSRELEIQT